jgi:hypothetical protein
LYQNVVYIHVHVDKEIIVKQNHFSPISFIQKVIIGINHSDSNVVILQIVNQANGPFSTNLSICAMSRNVSTPLALRKLQ